MDPTKAAFLTVTTVLGLLALAETQGAQTSAISLRPRTTTTADVTAHDRKPPRRDLVDDDISEAESLPCSEASERSKASSKTEASSSEDTGRNR